MLAILIVFNICRVSQERFIFFTHRVGVGDIDGLPCSNLSNSPATVAVIDVSIAIRCVNRTSKVVGICDNHVLLGLIIAIIHRNGVGDDFIDISILFVCTLGGFNRRFFRRHNRCVQNFRSISFHNRVGEAESHRRMSGKPCDAVSSVTIDGHTNCRDVNKFTIAIEEVLNQDILLCSVASVADFHCIIEGISNFCGYLINCLFDNQFAVRNLGLGLITRHFHGDLIRRNVLAGVIRVFARHMSRCNVLEEVGINIGDLNRISVRQSNTLTSRNRINDELAILVMVARTIHSGNLTSKVVGIRHCDVVDVGRLAVMNRDLIGNNIVRVSNRLVRALHNSDFAIFWFFDFDRIGRNRNFLAILRVHNLGLVHERRLILGLDSVGIDDVNGFTRFNLRNCPGSVTVINVAVSIRCVDFAREVVRIRDSQVFLGDCIVISHRNGVSNDFINLGNILVCGLNRVNWDFRFRNFNRRIQHHRRIFCHDHICEPQCVRLAGWHRSNGIRPITIIRHAVLADIIERSMTAKEVLDEHVLGIARSFVAHLDLVVQGISNFGDILIHALGDDDFRFGNFRLGAVTRYQNLNLVRRDFSIRVNRTVGVNALSRILGVFRVRARHECRCEVIKNLSRDISDLYGVGVGERDALPCLQLINDELTINEPISITILALNRTSKVIGIGDFDIVNIKALIVVQGDGVGYDFAGFGFCLVGSLNNGDFTNFGLLDIDRVCRDMVLTTFISVVDSCFIGHDGLIFCRDSVCVHDIDGLTGANFSNRPGVVTVIDITISIGGVDFASEVVGISDKHILLGLIIVVRNLNGIRHNFIDLRNGLVSGLLGFHRRDFRHNYSSIQDFRRIRLNHNVAEVDVLALTLTQTCNAEGAILITSYAIISRYKGQGSVTAKDIFNCHIFESSIACIGCCNRILECITNARNRLINSLGDFQLAFSNLGLGFVTRHLNLYLIGRNILIGVNRAVWVNTMARVVRVFRICARHMCRGDVFEDMSRYIGNLYGIGVGQNDICTCRDCVNNELSILEPVIGAVNASDFTSKVVGIGHHNVMHIEVLAVMNRHIVSNNFSRLSFFLIGFLMDGHMARFRNLNSYCIGRNIDLATIFQIIDVCIVDQCCFVVTLHRVGVVDFDNATSLNAVNRPGMVAIVGVALTLNRGDFTLKVVGVGNSQILLGFSIIIPHGNRVGDNVIDRSKLLVRALLGFDRNIGFSNSRIQNQRNICFYYSVAEMQFHRGASRQLSDVIRSITIRQNTDGRDVFQCAVAIEVVGDRNVIQVTITSIGDSDGVVQYVTNLGFRLINGFHDNQFALFGNISCRFIARYLDNDFIRRDILVRVNRLFGVNTLSRIIRVFWIRAWHMSCRNILQKFGRNIAGLNGISVMQCYTCTRFQLINDKLSVFETISASIHAGDGSCKVVGVSDDNILCIDGLTIVNRNSIGHDFARPCNRLVCTLDDGDFTFNRLINFDGVGLNSNRLSIFSVGHIGLVHDSAGIFALHRVGIHDFDRSACIQVSDGPCAVTVIDIPATIGRDDFTNKVIAIRDGQVFLRFIGGICDRNCVGYDLIHRSNILIGFLLNVHRRFFGNNNNDVINCALVTFLDRVGVSNVNGLASRQFWNQEVTVIHNSIAIAICLDWFANTIEVILNDGIISSSVTGVRDMERIGQHITNHCRFLINALLDVQNGFWSFAYYYIFVVRVTRHRVTAWIASGRHRRILYLTSNLIGFNCSIGISYSEGITRKQFIGKCPFTCICIITNVTGRCVDSLASTRSRILHNNVMQGCRSGIGYNDGVVNVFTNTHNGFSRLLLNSQTVFDDFNLNGVGRNIKRVICIGPGISFRHMHGSDVLNHGRVVLNNCILVSNVDALTNRQEVNYELTITIGISCARYRHQDTECIRIVSYSKIAQINRAIIDDMQSVSDCIAFIDLVLVNTFRDSYGPANQGHVNLIGRLFNLRNVIAWWNGTCGNVFKDFIREVVRSHRVGVTNIDCNANAQFCNRPGSVFLIVSRTGRTQRDNVSSEVIVIGDNNVIQLNITSVGHRNRVSDDIASSSNLLISGLNDLNIMANNIDIDIRCFVKPIRVRFSTVGNRHVRDNSFVRQRIVTIRAVVFRTYSVGINNLKRVVTVLGARQARDGKDAVIIAVFGIVRNRDSTSEVIGVLNLDVGQVMQSCVRNLNGVSDNLAIRSNFAVSGLLNVHLFGRNDFQHAINVGDVIVPVAVGPILQAQDSIARYVRALADFRLRASHGDRFERIMNAQGLIDNQTFGLVSAICQRSTVIHLHCAVSCNNKLSRRNGECAIINTGDNEVINFSVSGTNWILTNDFARYTDRYQMQAGANRFQLLITCFIRIAVFIGNIEMAGEFIRVKCAVNLLGVINDNTDSQRQDFKSSVNVNEFIVRVAEYRILSGNTVFAILHRTAANGAPLLCLIINDKGFFATDVINRIATLISSDGDFRNRVILTVILAVRQDRDNNRRGLNGLGARNHGDFVILHRFGLTGNRVLTDLFARLCSSIRAFRGDVDMTDVILVNQVFRILQMPSERRRVFLAINLLLVVNDHNERLLGNGQIAIHIAELVVVGFQSRFIVVDRVQTGMSLFIDRITVCIEAFDNEVTTNYGLVIMDTSTRQVGVTLRTDKSIINNTKFRVRVAIDFRIASINRNSDDCLNDGQRTVNDFDFIVRVVVGTSDSVSASVFAIDDIAFANIFAGCTSQGQVQRAVLRVNDRTNAAINLAHRVSKGRVGRAVNLLQMVNDDLEFQRADGDIAIQIDDFVVVQTIGVRKDFKVRTAMHLSIFQLDFRLGRNDILTNRRRHSADGRETNLTGQDGFGSILTLKASDIGIKRRVLLAIRLLVSTHDLDNQRCGLDGEISVNKADVVVHLAIFAVRADVVDVDVIDTHILARLTLNVTRQVARLYADLIAHLFGHFVADVVGLAVFAVAVMDDKVDGRVGVTVNLLVVLGNDSHRTRDNGDISGMQGNVILAAFDASCIDGIRANRTGLEVSVLEVRVRNDTGFFRCDFRAADVVSDGILVAFNVVIDGVAVVTGMVADNTNQFICTINDVIVRNIGNGVVGIQPIDFAVAARVMTQFFFCRRHINRIDAHFFAICTAQIECDRRILRVNTDIRVGTARASLTSQVIRDEHGMFGVRRAIRLAPTTGLNGNRARDDAQRRRVLGDDIVEVAELVRNHLQRSLIHIEGVIANRSLDIIEGIVNNTSCIAAFYEDGINSVIILETGNTDAPIRRRVTIILGMVVRRNHQVSRGNLEDTGLNIDHVVVRVVVAVNANHIAVIHITASITDQLHIRQVIPLYTAAFERIGQCRLVGSAVNHFFVIRDDGNGQRMNLQDVLYVVERVVLDLFTIHIGNGLDGQCIAVRGIIVDPNRISAKMEVIAFLAITLRAVFTGLRDFIDIDNVAVGLSIRQVRDVAASILHSNGFKTANIVRHFNDIGNRITGHQRHVFILVSRIVTNYLIIVFPIQRQLIAEYGCKCRILVAVILEGFIDGNTNRARVNVQEGFVDLYDVVGQNWEVILVQSDIGNGIIANRRIVFRKQVILELVLVLSCPVFHAEFVSAYQTSDSQPAAGTGRRSIHIICVGNFIKALAINQLLALDHCNDACAINGTGIIFVSDIIVAILVVYECQVFCTGNDIFVQPPVPVLVTGTRLNSAIITVRVFTDQLLTCIHCCIGAGVFLFVSLYSVSNNDIIQTDVGNRRICRIIVTTVVVRFFDLFLIIAELVSHVTGCVRRDTLTSKQGVIELFNCHGFIIVQNCIRQLFSFAQRLSKNIILL